MLDRLPFVSGRRRRREMMRTAFAGDGIEKAFVLAAMESLGIERIVETGTFTGKTTLWLGATFPNCLVQTSEVVPEVHESARHALAGQRNIRCYLADSGPWISDLCDGELGGLRVLFFLDAHGMTPAWSQEHPILAELRSIARRRDPTVVIIDDFKVPGRADYAFNYDGTRTSFGVAAEKRMSLPNALDVSMIADALAPEDVVLYPQYKYEDALKFQADPLHGNLIGYVVVLHCVSKDDLVRLLNMPLLRDHYLRVR